VQVKAKEIRDVAIRELFKNDPLDFGRYDNIEKTFDDITNH
jgi:hypothetical protein